MIAFDSPKPEILTVDQRDVFVAEIDLLLVAIFETDPAQSFEAVLKNNIRLSSRQTVESLVGQEHLETRNWEKFRGPLETLKKDLLGLPVARLTLAFEPSSSYLDGLIDILRSKTKQFVILDLVVEPLIVGGFSLVWQGKVFDNSVQSKLASWRSAFLAKPVNI